MAVIGSAISADSGLVSTGLVENVTIAVANVEQSHTFPVNTKRFEIQGRGNGKIKLAYAAGTSGTAYRTIYAGAYYREDEIGAASTTIYFQSPAAGLIVELTSWA